MNPTSIFHEPSADVAQVIRHIIEREGGATITNHHKDKGGQTKFGITQRMWDAYLKSVNGPADMDFVQGVTHPQAISFYNWYLDGYDALPLFIYLQYADAAVHMGHRQAGKLLQQTLNDIPHHNTGPLKLDGIIGSFTIARTKEIRRENARVFTEIYAHHRIERYIRICKAEPDQIIWLRGWYRRATEVRTEGLLNADYR